MDKNNNSDNRLSGFELEDNIETMFKVEPPLTPAPSKFGYIGVLLRDKYEDKIQCHICGEWFKSLAHHVRMTHGLHSKKYRIDFSLPKNFPLCGRSLSQSYADRASSKKHLEFLKKIRNRRVNQINSSRPKAIKSLKSYFNTEAYLNSKGLCKKQIISRYLIVADIVGRDPTVKDLKEHDFALLSAIQRRYDNKLNLFKEQNGFDVKHLAPKELKVSEEKAIAVLRGFYKKNKRVPVSRDFKVKGAVINHETFRKIFGSWNRALISAGFECKKTWSRFKQ